MKVLNRPMFRYGGPIKEGIMSGIQEPRQRYADAGEVFKNVESAYVRPDYESQVKAETIPSSQIISSDYLNKKFDKKFLLDENARIKENPMDFQFQYMTPEKYLNKFDTLVRADILTKPEARKYEFDKFVAENYADKIAKQKSIFEAAGDDRLKKVYGNERLVGTSGAPGGGDPKMYAKPKTTVKEVINNKDGAMELEQGPDRKEKINSILEGLGYDRAQKNALYDAMIKAGQRISRTGLGAENLVSDVIAETSQSYDKPEKLREAANLMQVQQDLKLDQIDASKTGGKLKQDYDFYKSQGDSDEVAEKKARNLPTTITEKFNASKSNTDSGKVYNVTMEITKEGFFGDKYKDSYNGRIAKKYKTVSEFIESEDFKGDGVYNFKGEAFLVENGKVTKRQIIQPKVDKEGFFS